MEKEQYELPLLERVAESCHREHGWNNLVELGEKFELDAGKCIAAIILAAFIESYRFESVRTKRMKRDLKKRIEKIKSLAQELGEEINALPKEEIGSWFGDPVIIGDFEKENSAAQFCISIAQTSQMLLDDAELIQGSVKYELFYIRFFRYYIQCFDNGFYRLPKDVAVDYFIEQWLRTERKILPIIAKVILYYFKHGSFLLDKLNSSKFSSFHEKPSDEELSQQQRDIRKNLRKVYSVQVAQLLNIPANMRPSYFDDFVNGKKWG